MPNNNYFLDLEKDASIRNPELERLRLQGEKLTDKLPRVPPDMIECVLPTSGDPNVQIIDLACGAGEWALRMAREFPHAKRIIGLDSFREAVNYANAEARTRQRNVKFCVGDIMQRLPYEDNTFNLVNARLITSIMPAKMESWVALTRECYRICKPGGMVQITEADNSSIVGAPAFHRMAQAIYCVMYRLGKTFSEYEIGVAPLMREFVEGGGFVDVRQYPYAIDYSAGADAHDAVVSDGLLASLLLKPALVREFGSEETYKQVYAEMEDELNSPDFRALWFLVRVCGRKPA